MSHCALPETLPARLPPTRAASADAIGVLVRRVLSGMVSYPVPVQRRQSQRTPYPQLVRAQAVDPYTLAPQDEPLVVVGKYLSEHGFGFFHNVPLAHRFVAITLEAPDAPPVRLLLDVSWCRFTRLGWYESGGRFLRVVD